MNDLTSAILAIVSGAFALAIISVLVSRQSQTPNVIQASGSALSGVIAAAVNPVTQSNPTSLGSNAFSAPSSGPNIGSIASTAADVLAAFA